MTTCKRYPYFLVAVQLGCLLYIAISGSVLSNNPAGLLIESAGIFLAIHAIYVVKIRNVNFTPTVKQNSELVTSGPYRIIRHPMYIAQLIAILPLIIDYFSLYRFAALLILLIILLMKIQYEEKQLIAHFPSYIEYQKNTNKLIPFVY
jgi:protein-S-isoprenylcysteine O-methyltransferase Ste14